jgi:dihydrofolate synthase/folylpolyglutamate synthase
MDYQGVLEYLNGVEAKGIELGIENTRQILHHFSHLQPGVELGTGKIRFIQVAGTNGKGSTSHFLASILQSAGYRVGLFTSPHVEDLRERITINCRWISREDFTRGLEAVKDLCENLTAKGLIRRMPTYFEYLFLVAIYYFSREKVDIAVLEVGLGGRLDATTALKPEVSVITTISRDHTAVLGSRVRDIAGEKAGIIKPGVPVVCGCRTGSVADRVIKEIAARNHAPFFNVIDSRNRLEITSHDHFYRCRYSTGPGDYSFEIRLNGSHQAYNAAAAIKAIQVLVAAGQLAPLAQASVCDGISNAFLPARIETLETSPPVILDGSHNVESTAALTRFLAEKKKNHLTLVFGVLADKNYRRMILLLRPYIQVVILTEPLSSRALPAQKMRGLFNGSTVIVQRGIEEVYHAARQFKRDILVTGSFYLVGAMRKHILSGG